MKLCLLAVICAVALALPASAAAASCAPPGNSGVSQYDETIPGAGCSHPTSGPGSGSSAGGGSVSPGTRRQLAAQGAAGLAVERLLGSTRSGPRSRSRSKSRGGSAGSAAGSPSAPAASGRGPLSALMHAVSSSSSSGGLGILLPLFLTGVLVLFVAALLLRRRRLGH